MTEVIVKDKVVFEVLKTIQLKIYNVNKFLPINKINVFIRFSREARRPFKK